MFLLAALLLLPVDETSYRHLIEAHASQIVLVDFWATWCEPCRAELPKLAALSKHGGFTLVTISTDEPEQAPAVRTLLRASRVNAPAYLKSATDNDRFINTVDPHWSGALPALFLYDRTGKLVQSFTGETDPRQVELAIRGLQQKLQ